MSVLKLLQVIGALGTVAAGVVSLFWPLRVRGFTGLEAPGGRGITEIRTVLGALFVGLGLAVLYFNSPQAYKVLGFSYVVMGVVRGVSMVVDKSVEQSNLVSLVFEVIFGILMLI